ncbi:hypothetical protein A7981_11550 [Methylovorus sp. MM2]|uniref:autotransporter outer membrane beta-barrel domain-containing protein n=1 Tax=Methylovorus sp. MM2 TaxID=1848038 RepID=UPI0007E11A12|nr:autotransporter outer membrane beta-barrel domain-containing protein [Methylovorus sp. MM2]OAM51156.1 hypothetical protein A7981_11550 [Methylovorus sp. MM2]
MRPLLLKMIWSLVVGLLIMAESHAACVDNGAGTHTCNGVSNNGADQVGKTVLDNSAAPVTLNNNANPDKTQETLISNDPYLPNTGAEQTIRLTGGSGAVTINNTGTIQMARGYYTQDPNDVATPNKIFTPVNPTSILFSATSTGLLLNNGVLAGIDAGIYSDSSTQLLTINNSNIFPGVTGVTARSGNIVANGDFSAAIFGSAQQIVITNNDNANFIGNDAYSHYSTETLSDGHWAIATFGGATYMAPVVQDGTQYANVMSAGLTTINNNRGYIGGDILVLDSNPLLQAAQERDNSLVLAYRPEDVGPRNSVINNTGGTISGNIYLGSGAHILNNGTLDGAGAGAMLRGNIYVDQRATAVTSVNGGVETAEYLVAGARTFTFNQMGQFSGEKIVIHDVAESVNNINVYSGLSDNVSNVTPDPSFDIVADGLGINNLNIYCVTGPPGCNASGDWIGLSSLNVRGTSWNFQDASQVIELAGGDINLEAQRVIFGATMKADNIIVNNLLQGVFAPENTNVSTPVDPDRMGTITGNLINNGDITVRDATLTVNGNALFNSGSNFNLRITSTGNGMLDIVNGTGSGLFAAGSNINVSAKDVFFRTGDTFTVATNTSGTPTITGPGAIVNFTSSIQSWDMLLTAQIAIPEYLNTNVAGNNAVNVLMDYAGNDEALTKLQKEIQGLSAEELKRAAERLRPEINDSLIRMTMQHTDRVLGVVESHLFDTYLASVKGEPRTEVDGKVPSGTGIWFQGFGGAGTQDMRKNVDGYVATSTGMATGIDRMIGDSDRLRVGFAGAYAYGNIDNSGITDNNRTNVNSYLGLAYGTWRADPWYFNSAIGLARHTYDTERVALGRNAEASHDSWQFTAKFDAGWPMVYNDLLTFVPLASFSYNRINESGYTEHGVEKRSAGVDFFGSAANVDVDSAINLRINKKVFNSYRTGVGGKILLSLQEPEYNAGVEVRALYVHEFGDLTNNSVAQFTHGGQVFNSPGIAPARGGIILGSSVRLTGNDENDQLTLLASYDADLRDKYIGQSLTLMLRYDFDQGPSYIKKAEFRKAAALARAQAADKPVAATDRDVAEIASAMAAPTLQDMLEFELSSPDEAIRLSAQKKKAVKAAIDNWINALINGNQMVYFNTYSSDFVNEDGMTRQQWERKRRQQMKDSGSPAIRITDLTIHAQGQQASTIFTQTSMIGDKQEVVQKIVELEEREGRWLIVSEDSVPLNGWHAARQ